MGVRQGEGADGTEVKGVKAGSRATAVPSTATQIKPTEP